MVEDFRDLLAELVKAEVRFLVVGAHALGALGAHGVPRAKIDLHTGLSGIAFDEAWPNRLEADFGDVRVPFLGRADLIRNKRASGRTKDLADVE